MATVAWQTMKSQFCSSLPYPTHIFSGQTIIITGSNTGMGLEAARHFARLDASRVILAVRDLSKGAAAKSSIESSTCCGSNVVQVWHLDLADYSSVAAFGRRVGAELDRLDVVVENAGILPYDLQMQGEDETTITVNLVNSMHHAVLMLPKLRETASRSGKETVLTFTGSWTHGLVSVDVGALGDDDDGSISAEGGILKGLARKVEGDTALNRYAISKLLQLLMAQELASQVTASNKTGQVTVSTVNPGAVKTDIDRGSTGLQRLLSSSFRWTLRSAEEGGRTLVHAAQGGRETHGGYLSDCAVGRPYESATGPAGVETQRRVWSELMAKLARINPATVGVI